MRKLMLFPAVVALGLATGVPAAMSAREVKVGDNYFVRPSGVPTVTVSKGTTVKWVWKGDSVHNVKVSKGPVRFGSGSKTSGSYKRKLTVKGTYTIICTVHTGADQKMKLVVQ